MSDSPLPRSPFAGTIDFSDDTPVHPIDPDELVRALQAHELYVETGQRSGQRANLDATDLAGKSFAGMKLWRIRMRRADLAGADFTGADLRRAILIGATMQGGRIAAADLTRGRLSGINLTDADGVGACLAEVDVEFAILGQFGLPRCGFSRRRYERCHSRRRKPEWREPAAREPAWRLCPEYPYIRCGPPGCSNGRGNLETRLFEESRSPRRLSARGEVPPHRPSRGRIFAARRD